MPAETIPEPPQPSLPRYGHGSLADLVPSLLAALDVPGFGDSVGLDPVRRACLLVIDGLGHELLLANAGHAPFLAGRAAARQPLTTGFPSTTAASLGSIGTGLPPGEHGLVGYTMRLPGMDRPVNSLRWTTYGLGGGKDLRDRFSPEVVQPSRTAFELAVNDGVEVTKVGAPSYARSGLTRAVLRGGSHADSYSLGDLAAVTAQRLGAGRRALVYAYHADLDVTGHVRGPDSEAWRLQLGQVDRLAAAIAERLPRDSLLVVTGDHGMVTLGQEDKIDPADHPELLGGVSVLAGEARARHVHTRPGATADVLAAWRELLGRSMWVVTGEQAIAEGWFGPRVTAAARERVGDVVAAAFGRVGVVQREVDPAQARMLGHHGSMTPSEQLVPNIVIRK
jgi:hypothetical protein